MKLLKTLAAAVVVIAFQSTVIVAYEEDDNKVDENNRYNFHTMTVEQEVNKRINIGTRNSTAEFLREDWVREGVTGKQSVDSIKAILADRVRREM